jgi:uncharacterized protein YdeI (YjbR/CyaY-like superfamily)
VIKPSFFKTPAAFRAWLARNHRRAKELRVGFHKKASGKPSITWPEAVDQALCFGWIDGIRHRVDDDSYEIRFTPRNPGSTWSAINLKRVAALRRRGLMRPAGLAVFRERDPRRTARPSFEQRRRIKLAPRLERLLRANRKAWRHFRAQAPWYQRSASFWVMSAKQEATRLRRLATLIANSERGRRA